MTVRGSETASGDVWGPAIDDYESALAELDKADEGNADNGQSSGESAGDNASNNEGEKDEESPKPDEAKAKFDEWMNAELDAIERGDTETKFYKGLQKVVNKKQAQIDELTKLVNQSVSKLQEYETMFESMGEGFEWLTKTTMNALPEDVSKNALLELQGKRNEQLRKQLQARQGSTEVQAQQGDDDEPAEVKAYKAKFLEGRKARAKRAGVDPDDPALDYGTPNEAIADRVEKFEASLDRLLEKKEQERLDKVSQKNEVVGTRNAGGGTPKTVNYDGRDTLSRGAMQRLNELRKQAGVI